MTKRPSIIGGLDLPGGTPDPEGAAPVRRTRPDIVHTSIYLPKEVHRRLREIAFARDVKIHDVIMEGIDAALQKHGHPSVEALKAGSKPAS